MVRAPLSEDLGRSCVLVRCRPVLSVHLTAEAGRNLQAWARRTPVLSFSCINNNSILMDSQSGSPSGTYAVASGQAEPLNQTLQITCHHFYSCQESLTDFKVISCPAALNWIGTFRYSSVIVQPEKPSQQSRGWVQVCGQRSDSISSSSRQ